MISAQKDRTQPYLSLLQSLLENHASSTLIVDLITFGHYFTQSTSMTSILGRAVLNAYVVALCAGSGFQPALIANQLDGSHQQWERLGQKLFASEEGEETLGKVVEGVLEGGGGGWCDEQVSSMTLTVAHFRSPPFVDCTRTSCRMRRTGQAPRKRSV